jgi:hypothetical protein
MRDRVYTAEMGQPPMEPDGGSAMPGPKKPMPMPKPAMKRPAPPMKRPAGGGMFREGMPVPQDIDGASATPTPRAPGMKKGGSVSSRADGIAKKGKTNCKMY